MMQRRWSRVVVWRMIGACASVIGMGLVFQVQALRAAGRHDVERGVTSPPADSALRAEIVRMLDSGAAAWNRGDLDRFVSDYAPDTTTTFIGSRGIVRGRAAIRAAYAPRFAPGGTRDSLSFERVEVDQLAPDVINTIAYYRLMRGDSTTGYGPTSLVMRKIDGHWKIIHDHSS